MEYKLNRIDTELREMIKEVTIEGKIHHKTGNEISNDKKQDNDKRKFNQYKKSLRKGNITITAVKQDNATVEIEAINEDIDTKQMIKGNFLDIRK
jgi:hypothetical protein